MVLGPKMGPGSKMVLVPLGGLGIPLGGSGEGLGGGISPYGGLGEVNTFRGLGKINPYGLGDKSPFGQGPY